MSDENAAFQLIARTIPSQPCGETFEAVEIKRNGDDLLVRTKDGRRIRFVNVKVESFKISGA